MKTIHRNDSHYARIQGMLAIDDKKIPSRIKEIQIIASNFVITVPKEILSMNLFSYIQFSIPSEQLKNLSFAQKHFDYEPVEETPQQIYFNEDLETQKASQIEDISDFYLQISLTNDRFQATLKAVQTKPLKAINTISWDSTREAIRERLRQGLEELNFKRSL